MSRHFIEWLKQPPRNLAFAEYCRLSDEDSHLLLDAYAEYNRKTAKKVGRLEHRKKEKFDKYLGRLREKKAKY
jgi:hypothetical protein